MREITMFLLKFDFQYTNLKNKHKQIKITDNKNGVEKLISPL